MWAAIYQTFSTDIKLSTVTFIQKHLLHADSVPGLLSTFNQFSEVGINISTWKSKELHNLSKFRLPIAHTEHVYKLNEGKKMCLFIKILYFYLSEMDHNVLILLEQEMVLSSAIKLSQ